MSDTHRLTLQGRAVSYLLKRSRRRTIGFAIGAEGLSVTAPERVSRQEIEAALQSKSSWICAKLSQWEARPQIRRLAFETGDRLPWLGGELELRFVERGVRTRVTQQEDIITVSLDGELTGPLRRATIRNALVRYYKREGERLMAPKVEAYARALGQSVRKVVVRDQKRRWGSCASDRTIRLNWRLMGFPEELIDYVCAHEAAHLVEMNHSPAYWAQVTRVMPDWKVRREAVRERAEEWIWAEA